MARSPTVQLYRTISGGKEFLKRHAAQAMRTPSGAGSPSVFVDSSRTYQEIEGFGGAFTEAAAYVFSGLPAAERRRFLRACFDTARGNGYTLCRTHMNSCDFSLGNYACADTPGDMKLKSFSIAREKKWIVPMMKAALKTAGRPFKLFISPWSPPAWMKTSGEMNHGGKLKPECRAAWALYYCRFIQALEREGIPVWGLTVQNEPEASQTWDSCIWTAEEERDFVRDHLGPTLKREKLGRIKVMIWDHNRDRVYERARVAYEDPKASRYIWGAGFHWYCGDFFDNLQAIHDAYPDKRLLFTEGCQEGGPHIGSWAPAERYARAMIHDLNRWAAGWVDWNMLLDEKGGPNHVGNFCSAPILADTAAGRLMIQGSYYYIGHFSRFIRPGARRILCASTHDDLETTAFLNPGGACSVVILNRSENDIPVTLKTPMGAVQTASPKHSITTAVIT